MVVIRDIFQRQFGMTRVALELELLEQADLVESYIADPETEFFSEDMTELDSRLADIHHCE